MTTPVTAALPVVATDPTAPAADVPPDLFAALLAGTAVPPVPVPLADPGTAEVAAETPVDGCAPAAWAAATTTVPLAGPVVTSVAAAPPAVADPAATPVRGEHRAHPLHPEHPVHPEHPLHPEHPVHPAHPLHPVHAVTTVDADPVVPPAPAPVEDALPEAPGAAPVEAVPEQPAVPDQPVAAPVEAVAAQVAAPEAPAPTQQPDQTSPVDPVRPAVAAAARRLQREGDVQSLVVRLDPPELGAVLVRMTVRDGHVEVSLRAPDVAARGDLLAQAPEIAQVVRDAGLDLSSFDVTLNDAWTGADRQQQESTDRGTPRRSPRADGTATSVTDDALHPADPQPAGTWL